MGAVVVICPGCGQALKPKLPPQAPDVVPGAAKADDLLDLSVCLPKGQSELREFLADPTNQRSLQASFSAWKRHKIARRDHLREAIRLADKEDLAAVLAEREREGRCSLT